MNDSVASSGCVCVCTERRAGWVHMQFKVRVQDLLSGAALEMFLSCCLSFLLSWRISSRSLASPSSPPPTVWEGWRWMDGMRERKKQKRTFLKNPHGEEGETTWNGAVQRWRDTWGKKGRKNKNERKQRLLGNVRDNGKNIDGRGMEARRGRGLSCTISKPTRQKTHSWQMSDFIMKMLIHILHSDSTGIWYWDGHSKIMYKTRACNADFSSHNICKWSVGEQTHNFTAYWSCQHGQGEKCCHHLCHSCSTFGTGIGTDNTACSTRKNN